MATLTESNTQAFTVGGIPSVSIANTSGNVRIVPGDDNSVHVSYTKEAKAQDDATARAILDNIEVDLTQTGDAISVATRFDKHGAFRQIFTGGTRINIDIAVTVPRATNLRLVLNSGAATLTGITGACVVHVNSGHLTASDMRIIDQGELRLNSGDVQLENVTVAALTRLEMNSGNILLRDVTFAATVDLRANSGTIKGDLTLADSADLRLTINSGSINLTLPETTAAHVEAAALAGALHVNGFPLTITRRYAATRMSGDLAPNPTSTITCKLNSGNFALAAR